MCKLSNNSQAQVPPAIRKVKASNVVPVVILVVSVIGTLYFLGYFNNLNVLTPTRDIVGTWKTTFSTKFNIATDWSNGYLEDVGSENRIMTWTITSTDQENIVKVQVEFSYSNRHLIPDSGYTPDISPTYYTGIINGTQLILTTPDVHPIKQIGSVGVFTFTTHNMEGTWHNHWGVYDYDTQNVYTSTNGLKLIKQ